MDESEGKALGSEEGKVLGSEFCHRLKKKVERDFTGYLLSES
jgi:hypothetical protein